MVIHGDPMYHGDLDLGSMMDLYWSIVNGFIMDDGFIMGLQWVHNG